MSRPILQTEPERVVLDAVRRVADGEADSLLLRSSASGHPWIQVSRVTGETSLLCEGTSNEYLARYRQLSPRAIERLHSLGWRDTSDAPFARWVDVGTRDEQTDLASLLLRTLVEVYGHDPRRPPSVRRP